MPMKAYPEIALPSNLSYRQRLELLELGNAAEYNRLHCKSYTPTVWERLLEDASTRQDRRAHSKPWVEGSTAGHSTSRISGFNTNTDKAVYTPLVSFKTGHNAELNPTPQNLTHPQLVRKYHNKNKIDYMSDIRPDTQTVNQTMRMLGTYETDPPHARKLDIPIPPLCPAQEGQFFHPDVRISGLAQSMAGTVHASLKQRDHFAGTGLQRRPASAHPALGSRHTAVNTSVAAGGGGAGTVGHGQADSGAGDAPETGSRALQRSGSSARMRPSSARPASHDVGGGVWAGNPNTGGCAAVAAGMADGTMSHPQLLKQVLPPPQAAWQAGNKGQEIVGQAMETVKVTGGQTQQAQQAQQTQRPASASPAVKSPAHQTLAVQAQSMQAAVRPLSAVYAAATSSSPSDTIRKRVQWGPR